MKQRPRIGLLLAVSLILVPLWAWGGEPLAINTFGRPPLARPDGAGLHDRIAEEAFRRLGIKISMHRLPAERALMMVNEGFDDGDLPRVKGLSLLYPNIVRVPEKVVDYDFVAFSRSRDILIDGWESLSDHSVAIITGWKILEKNLATVRELVRVRHPEQLFELLNLGRVEVVVYERWQGLYMIRDLGFTEVHALSPPLASREMFLYLHKRHRSLVPKVTSVLQDMRREGWIQELSQKVLAPYVREESAP
ncbi:MAG: transporter substrate-binding domain-containing protein [Magnetococcales bacterium]|nr:transporter substrate-binding domain-containing protein [Magnetococcales bacterium]